MNNHLEPAATEEIRNDHSFDSSTANTHSLTEQRLLHQLCWEFEDSLRNGEPANLDQWLNRRGELDRELVLAELLSIELEVRLSCTQTNLCDHATDAYVGTDTRTADSETTTRLFLLECKDRIPNDVEIVHDVIARFQQSKSQLPLRRHDGRYEFIHELARGGTGEVWRVFDRHLRREAAIKVLLDSHNTPQMRKRLEQEARLCGRMKHPGIVPIHELGHFDEGTPFVSMKLVEGSTLADLLESRDRPDQARLVRVFLDACEAVAYAHKQGIIHRDLKPQNIMVGEFNEVQVMDWGLGKELPASALTDIDTECDTVVLEGIESTQVGTVFGTIAYMSPEQARGELDRVGRQSDVFSLGAILCRILTGTPVYQAENQQLLLEEARNGNTSEAISRLNSCKADSRLRKLAIECLSANSDDRPTDAGEVTSRLKSILQPRFFKRTSFVALLASALVFSSIIYHFQSTRVQSTRVDSHDRSGEVAPRSIDPPVGTFDLLRTEVFDVQAHLDRAAQFESQQNWQDSERVLRGILDHDSECRIAYESLYRVLKASGQTHESAIIAREAWKHFPENRDVTKNFVRVIFDEPELPANYETWQSALASRPFDVQLHYEIGWMLNVHSKLDDAERVYQRSNQLAPECFIGYYGLSVVLIQQERFPEAIVSARRAIELGPDDLNFRGAVNRLIEDSEKGMAKAALASKNEN